MSRHHRHRATPPPRPRWPLILLLTLAMLALAVLLAVQVERAGRPVPAPSTTATAAPLAADFAEHMRRDLPTLDISLGNSQLETRAQEVCDALDASPMDEVYGHFDMPVTDPQDASRFLAAAVAWKCPDHMAALAELTR